MKLLFIMAYFLFAYCTVAIAQDSVTQKYANYQRSRGISDNTPAKYERRKYVSESGDTLVQEFARAMSTNDILRETSYLHNKKNGLEITYYPNGIISTVDYYLDGRLWQVISRADTSGRLIDPGTLQEGTGIVLIYSVYGFDSLGYETYKNGYPEGKYAVKEDTYLIQGYLTYKRSAVNYLPGKKVTYTNLEGKVGTGVFKDDEYASLFLDTSHGTGLKVLSVSQDSVMEGGRDWLYLPLYRYFSDPAIIPKGKWTMTNTRTSRVVTMVLHDDNGNPVKVVKYKQNGDVLSSQEFPSCNKRKLLKRSAEGEIIGEYCPN
jgi:hypothetical protein